LGIGEGTLRPFANQVVTIWLHLATFGQFLSS